MLSRYPSLLLVAGWLWSCLATQPEPLGNKLSGRANGDLCNIYSPRIALVENSLYFMADNYTFLSDVNGGSQGPVSSLYWIDLDTSFRVDSSISIDSIHSSSIPQGLTPSVDLQVNGTGGSLFTDDTALYIFAGIGSGINQPDTSPGDNTLAAYNTSTGKWTSVEVSGGNFQFGDRVNGESVSTPNDGLSFYLGGGYEDEAERPGLLRFDASDPMSLKWSNETDSGVPSVSGGAMVYVPMGDAGVVLLFGGYDTSHHANVDGSQPPWDYDVFSQISVYDIASSTWYKMPATGDVPSNRSQFCAAVSAAPDYSSFQVTMYGGISVPANSSQQPGYSNEDVYVLAIPSFKWIKTATANEEQLETSLTTSNGSIGRYGHKCAMWNDSQMIVVGGKVSQGEALMNNSSTCDIYPPLRVLDTSTFTWMLEFSPNVTYTVPSVITDVIGTSPNGNASLRSPANPWPNAQLQRIFSKTLPRKNQTAPSSKKPAGHSYSAAVAGIACGAIGVLLLIFLTATLIVWMRRRKPVLTPKGPSDADVRYWAKPERPTMDAQKKAGLPEWTPTIVHHGPAEMSGRSVIQHQKPGIYPLVNMRSKPPRKKKKVDRIVRESRESRDSTGMVERDAWLN